MPLHLLGKKSWNVYNQDNIERVRRDEAAAQAAAQEAEKRRLDDEATDRLALLRGGAPIERGGQEFSRPSGAKRKREDEWDRANRLAESEYQRQESGLRTSTNVAKDLIPMPAAHGDKAGSQKPARDNNAEPSFEQLSNMRMIDAAGKHKDKSAAPWYHNTGNNNYDGENQAKDVWGNSDPSRAVRNKQRIDASDPLLAMKQGVKQLREVEKKRQAFRQEREQDLVEVEEMARRREKHERRHRHRHRHRRHDHETERARRGEDGPSSRRHRGDHTKQKSSEDSRIERPSSRVSHNRNIA